MSNKKNITNFEKHYYGGDKRAEEKWRLTIKKEKLGQRKMFL